MSTDITKNYYLILELDPDETDENCISGAIKKKQSQWSRERNHPNTKIKREAQQYLAEIASIKKIMLDTNARQEEARKAKKIVSGIRDKHHEAFAEAVLLLSKGNVTDQAIKNLATKFKDSFFTEADIRNELSTLQIASSKNETAGKTLDQTTTKAIRDNLDLLKLENLYDFLGVDKKASSLNIKQKISDIDKRLKVSQINPENDIKKTLISYCTSIFRSAEDRKKYDESLKQERMGPFVESIERCCDTGSIEIGQILLLIEKAKKFSLGEDEALGLIHEKASKRKVPVNISKTVSFGKQIDCYCGHKNKLLAELCSKCGKSLFVKCPQCHLFVAIDSLGCSCGFSLEKVHDQLRVAHRVGNEEEFLSLWDDKAFRNHPKFSDLAKYYDSVKSKRRAQEFEKRELNNRLNMLKKAIRENNNVAIRQYWDKESMGKLRELQPFLNRIKEAHRPQDVENVNASDYQSYIQVKWDLVDGINNYLVAWSHTRMPSTPQGNSYQQITRGHYERVGFRIENPSHSNYFIKVFSLLEFNGEVFLSPGQRDGCTEQIRNRKKTIIEYTMKFSGFPQKNICNLILSSDTSIQNLPEMVLIMRKGKVIPSDIHSGEQVYKIGNQSLHANTEQIFKFKIRAASSPSSFRLFLKKPYDLKYYELMPQNIQSFRR